MLESDDAGATDEQLVSLRNKADDTEIASIAKAAEVREAIAAIGPAHT